MILLASQSWKLIIIIIIGGRAVCMYVYVCVLTITTLVLMNVD